MNAVYIILTKGTNFCHEALLVLDVPKPLEYDVSDWSRHVSHVVSPPLYIQRGSDAPVGLLFS